MPSKAYIGRSSKEPKGSVRQVRSVSRTIATWAHHILSFAVSPTPQGVAVAGVIRRKVSRHGRDRKSVVSGKRVSVRVDLGGIGEIIKKTKAKVQLKK